jgi:hypothetical protein
MREASMRLGQLLSSALQQAHKGSCSPQPCVVAVTPLPVQPPPKPTRLVGTPIWRDPRRAKPILDQEDAALRLTQERFEAWLKAKRELVEALGRVQMKSDVGAPSRPEDWCCGGSPRRDRDPESVADDGALLNLKQVWRACKANEGAFECAWARTKTMNADLLDQLTLQSGDILDIFSRCACDEHEAVAEDERIRREDQAAASDIYEMKALMVAESADTTAEEAHEAAERAEEAARGASAAAEALQQATTAAARRAATGRAETAAAEADTAARLAGRAAEKARRNARRAQDVAAEGTGQVDHDDPGRSRVARACGEVEHAAARAREASDRAANAAQYASAEAGRARSAVRGNGEAAQGDDGDETS